MRTTKAGSSRWLSLAWPAALGVGGLSATGAAVLLWLVSADEAGRRVVTLAAVAALAALLGLTWYASRVLADRRQRAALDRYAEQEETKRIHLRRNIHARTQSQTG